MSSDDQLWHRAERVLAGGPATLSKHPSRFAFGIAPKFLVRGRGCRVFDVDNNCYIDTIAALGPIILGYDYPHVQAAVMAQVDDGPLFSLAHPLEVEVAELLVENIKSIDMVRFAKNGADVTQTAVRLARRLTNNRHVIRFEPGYHGGHDWYIASTEKRGGVLSIVSEYTHVVPWGDIDRLHAVVTEEFAGDVACIILEIPALTEEWTTEAVRAYLHDVQFLAHQEGLIFILDEIVTGFRYGLGGLQDVYGLDPDLTCLGKGMANGYPLAAIGGKAEIMRLLEGGDVFLSTTNGGDAISLAAAKGTMQALTQTSALAQLQAMGIRIQAGLKLCFEMHDTPATIIGDYGRMGIVWRQGDGATAEELKALWLQETVKHSVLFGGPLFPTASMGEGDVGEILEAARLACLTIRDAVQTGTMHKALQCPAPSDVFWRR